MFLFDLSRIIEKVNQIGVILNLVWVQFLGIRRLQIFLLEPY